MYYKIMAVETWHLMQPDSDLRQAVRRLHNCRAVKLTYSRTLRVPKLIARVDYRLVYISLAQRLLWLCVCFVTWETWDVLLPHMLVILYNLVCILYRSQFENRILKKNFFFFNLRSLFTKWNHQGCLTFKPQTFRCWIFLQTCALEKPTLT